MSSNLSQPQFGSLFHGTIHPLEGDTLRPGQRFGATTPGQDPWASHGQSRKDYVSATDDEGTAWNFAAMAHGQRVHGSGEDTRLRVHEVEPNEQTRIGVENAEHPVLQRAFDEDWYTKPKPAGEHVAPEFKVKRTLDIKPGHQGTFPGEDWNRYRTGGHEDANHPSGEHGGPDRFMDRVKPLRPAPPLRQRKLGEAIARDENASIARDQGRLF